MKSLGPDIAEMLDETWRDVRGFEGFYQVSDLGRVRSMDRVIVRVNRWGKPSPFRLKGKVLSPSECGNGYLRVNLGADDWALVHRLVADTFLPNDEGLPEVNHKDGVLSNNRKSNLEWVTSSENKLHSYSELVRKEHALKAGVRLVKGDDILTFDSALAAAKHFGVDHGSILSALKREHRCRGYTVERR